MKKLSFGRRGGRRGRRDVAGVRANAGAGAESQIQRAPMQGARADPRRSRRARRRRCSTQLDTNRDGWLTKAEASRRAIARQMTRSTRMARARPSAAPTAARCSTARHQPRRHHQPRRVRRGACAAASAGSSCARPRDGAARARRTDARHGRHGHGHGLAAGCSTWPTPTGRPGYAPGSDQRRAPAISTWRTPTATARSRATSARRCASACAPSAARAKPTFSDHGERPRRAPAGPFLCRRGSR